jgi:glycosyltransferase involved in cell wall biosynthesis
MKFIDGNFPRISIVTPSFNQAVYLEKCIKSVLTQNYPNLEYIVMDGGSTDGSVEIIKRYEPYITYWQSQPDGGQAAAIGDGFQRSTGELLSWINSDDFLCKDALFKVAESYQKNHLSGLFYGNSFWVDQIGNLRYPLLASPMIYRNWIYGTCSVFQGSVFFTDKAYKSVNGINMNLVYSMEYELFWKIAKNFPTTYVPDFIACFRDQPNSKGNKISHIGRQEFREILLNLANIDSETYKYKMISSLLRNKRRLLNKIFHPDRLFKNYQTIFGELTAIS